MLEYNNNPIASHPTWKLLEQAKTQLKETRGRLETLVLELEKMGRDGASCRLNHESENIGTILGYVYAQERFVLNAQTHLENEIISKQFGNTGL